MTVRHGGSACAFFRSFLAVIPLVVFGWVRAEFPHGLANKKPFQHPLRPSFGVISRFISIATLAYLTLAEARFEYGALLWPLLADLLIFRLSLSIRFTLAAPLFLAGAAIAAVETGRRARTLHL